MLFYDQTDSHNLLSGILLKYNISIHIFILIVANGNRVICITHIITI